MSVQNKTIICDNQILKYSDEETLFEVLCHNGYEASFCAGKGICGRCKVRFLNQFLLPTLTDRRVLAPEELRDGVRLACRIPMNSLVQIQGQDDIKLETLFQEKETPILTSFQNIPMACLEKDGFWGGEVRDGLHTKGEDASIVSCFAIVDLGSTTVVIQLVDATTGRMIGTERFMNPQRIYGADVITRMQASIEGKAVELKEMIREAILNELNRMMQQTGHKFQKVYLAGNTTMIHLFMGYPMEGMAQYPFTPWNKNQITENIDEYQFTIFPAISAFVGGDIVSGAFALLMHSHDTMSSEDKANYRLLIDLGTNGEIFLSNGEKMYATATAAGPAFENSNILNIPGSDMIRLIADLRKEQLIDETGLLDEEAMKDVNQSTIREIQKAKAAIRVGIELLMEHAGITPEAIDKVYLAGGFGKGLDVESAVCIGLFPTELCSKVVAVGNSSLAGIYLYGMNVYAGKEAVCRDSIEKITSLTEEVNLAMLPKFNERYLKELNL